MMQRDLHANDGAIETRLLDRDASSSARNGGAMNERHVMHIAEILHHTQVRNGIIALHEIGSRAWIRRFRKPRYLRGGFRIAVPVPDEAVLLSHRERCHVEAARRRMALAVSWNQDASAGGIKTQSVKGANEAIVADPSKA